MTTPTKQQIIGKAIELFQADNDKYITPEVEELQESGYYNQAKIELMQGDNVETVSYVEQLAHDLGFRLIPEKQHDDLIYYQLKNEKLKEKIKHLENSTPREQPQQLVNLTLQITQPQIEIEKPEEPAPQKTAKFHLVAKPQLAKVYGGFKLITKMCILILEGKIYL